MCESRTLCCHAAATKERLKSHCKTKYVKGVSCVYQLCSVNIHTVAQNLPIWARLTQFWKTWTALRVSPKVIRGLKEVSIYIPSGTAT